MTIKMAFMTFLVSNPKCAITFTQRKQIKIIIDENRNKQTTRNESFISFKENKK